MSASRGARIHITGVVQGVGFRPFVYGLATRFSLAGWVRNTSAGVDIEVEGASESLQRFISALRGETPPLARIDELVVEERAPDKYSTFEILPSESIAGAFQPISPDVGVCRDCLSEMLDPGDRRYRYPFINCTHCGPRFTIIEDIPYDRPNTTMAPFGMCPACFTEYEDPLDRRFHAQPVACPECGPHVWLEVNGTSTESGDQALTAAQRMLGEGSILAVKGLGGFHLACDATNPRAVTELRRRKLRVDKAFALMMPDLAAVGAHCVVDRYERNVLQSQERPIVILRRRPESTVAREAAPGQDTLGVMLPYTPLHVLLMEGGCQALVMTSGNLSEEPIATDNEEARTRLAFLADGLLLHNRGIRTRCDDSVVRAFEGKVYPLRRSRGYAPFPVHMPWETRPLLAVGGELKNTFCLTRGGYAFLSQHIGDMENYETLRSFEEGVAHLERLFRVQPEAIACDEHPDYMATRYSLERAEKEGIPLVEVQHHHAHIAACMAENGLAGDHPVIGVAFDGTGYGKDGVIWGGEFLVADYQDFTRPFHLATIPMPGGDAAVRSPWRLALAWLRRAGLDWEEELPPVEGVSAGRLAIVRRQLDSNINAPLTSSMGRLFDAVSALAGVRWEVNYEAQAAIELEALADQEEKGQYRFRILDGEIDPLPVIQSIVEDRKRATPAPTIAARFHNGVAAMVLDVCCLVRDRTGLAAVALSGGVWQNMTLLGRAVRLLRAADFSVLLHEWVPPNDGGLALGQAAVAQYRWRGR